MSYTYKKLFQLNLKTKKQIYIEKSHAIPKRDMKNYFMKSAQLRIYISFYEEIFYAWWSASACLILFFN